MPAEVCDVCGSTEIKEIKCKVMSELWNDFEELCRSRRNHAFI